MSAAKRLLAYVIVLEPLWAPILQSQVIDLLCSLPEARRKQLFVLWFYRPDWLLRHGERIRALEKLLGQHGIPLIKLPVLGRKHNARYWVAPLVALQVAFGLLYARARYRFTACHGRSYMPSLAVACLKRVGARLQLLFDPRSDFPEENVANGRWTRASRNYRFWKAAEHLILRQSDAVVAVTGAMLADLQASVPRDPAVLWRVIPNNYTAPHDSPPPTPPGRQGCVAPALCYAGSIRHGYWNNVATYLSLLERILERRPTWQVTFLVHERQVQLLTEALQASQLPPASWNVASVNPKDVVATLTACTVGLQVMRHRDSRMGVKVAEYLAAGLPVLTSENVLGAAEIVRQFDVGMVLDDDYGNLDEALAYIEDVFAHREQVRQRCRKVAQATFSTQAVAGRYEAVYAELLP
ncbi:MAG TPA: glycosyltransferase [Trueperaceae bacterium]